MAKTKGVFSFKDIGGLTNGIIKKMPIQHETLKTSQSRGTIGTGIYVLNAAISSDIYGGIPDNRITVFGAPSGTGKSFLCYSIAKEAQKKGIGVIYIDTEYAIELDQLPGYGIDISEDKFMLIRTNIIEDVKVMLTQLLDGLKEQKDAGNEVQKFIIFMDSVGQLGSRKEVDDALSGKEKADFTKAKALSSLFRIINSDLGYLGIPLVCTNHTYQCVTGETKVMLANGTFKEINKINTGEFVKTLSGDKEVNFVKKYENAPVLKITMEDGTIIKCTSEHKFLVKPEWSEDENDTCWKNAIDLTESDVILSI